MQNVCAPAHKAADYFVSKGKYTLVPGVLFVNRKIVYNCTFDIRSLRKKNVDYIIITFWIINLKNAMSNKFMFLFSVYFVSNLRMTYNRWKIVMIYVFDSSRNYDTLKCVAGQIRPANETEYLLIKEKWAVVCRFLWKPIKSLKFIALRSMLKKMSNRRA